MIKKYFNLFFSMIACLFLCSCVGIDSGGKFDDFTNDFFTSELASNTMNLHFTLSNPDAHGLADCQASLGHISDEARQNEKNQLEDYADFLDSINFNSLSKKQQLDYEVLSDFVSTELALNDYYFYQEILSPSGGIHIQLPLLLAEYRFDSKKDIENYLSLISLYDSYFREIADFEKTKAKKGLFMNDSLCVQVLKECENFIDKPDENYLLSSFEKRINDADFLSDNEKEKLILKNKAVVQKHVFPAYENLMKTLTNLLGSGRNDGGLCFFKDGKKYYELLVYKETGCSESVDEINKMISESRNNALKEMKNLLSKSSDLAIRCENYKWNYKDENEMIEVLKKAIKKDFPAVCDSKCNVCFVDESLSEELAPAFYITAPLDDYYDNYIYINDAKDYSNIKYFTTLAHEGYPGHLYQTVMSYNYGLSPFRSLLNYGGFTEGWATYTEMLSYHYAGLDEDVASFLQLNQEATLSLYASSDIGIHYLGWNFEDMCKLWNEFGITDDECIADIMDYIISEPGNYLKYYVGYLKFKQLKATDSNSMAFHKAVLKIGPAPFDIVEKYLK